MSLSRALKVAALLVLWLPLVWMRFPGAEERQELPVQARLQAVLAARMFRVADLGGPPLTDEMRQALRRSALELLEEGLQHQPTDEWLATRKAVLLAASGDRAAALALLARLKPSPLVATLTDRYSGRPVKPGVLETAMTGYYDSLLTGARVEEERRQAGRDLAILQALAVLTLGNAALGLLAVLGWPFYQRRLARDSPGFSAHWSALGALACAVGFQWLSLLVAVPLSTVLHALGFPTVAMVVTVQVALYLLALGLILRLLPALARSDERPWALLGLRRPRWRDLGVGLVGFWMAVPAVFAASWLTSQWLGRAPFSSNDALELLATASPLGLAAMALLVACLGPFFEEVLFRGVLYAGLRGVLGRFGAGAVSAGMFALVHGDPQAILVLSALGALFAFLYERTGSLWPAVVAHALWNGTTTLVVTLVLLD